MKKRFHVKYANGWADVSVQDRYKVIMSVPLAGLGLNIAKSIAQNFANTLNSLNDEIDKLKGAQ